MLRFRLAAESLQLQSLHRSLLESRQQQQMLQQQQQQQLQQQQQFIEQQQHAFAQRQLQAESEVATKQLELDQARPIPNLGFSASAVELTSQISTLAGR